MSIKKEKLEHWSSCDSGSWFKDDTGAFIGKAEELVISKSLSAKKYQNGLEVGIGNGRLMKSYGNNCDQIVGIDFSKELLLQSINFADKKGIKYHCVMADAVHLPFKEDAFDLTICSRVLQHIPFNERKNSIEEMKRVSKNHGTILLLIYNQLSLFGLSKILLRIVTKDHFRHSKFNTYFDMKSISKSINLPIIRCKGAVFMPVEILKSLPNKQVRKMALKFCFFAEKLVDTFPFKFLCGRLLVEYKVGKKG